MGIKSNKDESNNEFNYFLKSDLYELLERSRENLHKLSDKSVLVTGAAGFLGRYFIALFQLYNLTNPKPIKIVALDNHITSLKLDKNDERKTDPNIEWIVGDAEIGAKLPDNFEYILHIAGVASPVHYQANPLETIDVTVNATRLLLEKAKTLGARLLYFSSSEIYGDPESAQIPTDENYRGNVSPRGPRACYDESKRLGETLCWVYENYFNVHASVVRPFNIYGPGMMPNDYRVMPNFANALISGEPLKVYGNGNQTRTFCYVTDAIIAFLLILTEGKNPDVYNIGNPTPEISIFELATLFLKINDIEGQIETINYPSQYPTDDPSRRCPNINKLQSEFNFKPMVDLAEGITRFSRWTQENYPKLNL